jgi:DNA-binding NarL/FixJ family response regulator
MLALTLARHGSVRDGLLALLEATPGIDQIVQVEGARPAWDFVQTLCPDITLIYSTSLTQDILTFIENVHGIYRSPILTIVSSEADRKAAMDAGADMAIIEGLPSSKLSLYITTLVQQSKQNELWQQVH